MTYFSKYNNLDFLHCDSSTNKFLFKIKYPDKNPPDAANLLAVIIMMQNSASEQKLDTCAVEENELILIINSSDNRCNHHFAWSFGRIPHGTHAKPLNLVLCQDW